MVIYNEQTFCGFKGLLTSSPPQFGQMLFKSFVQGEQNVHSWTHIYARVFSSIEELQRSHFFLISNAILIDAPLLYVYWRSIASLISSITGAVFQLNKRAVCN